MFLVFQRNRGNLSVVQSTAFEFVYKRTFIRSVYWISLKVLRTAFSKSTPKCYHRLTFKTPFRYGANVKIVHFLGSVKPWHQSFDESTGKVNVNVRSASYSKADEDFNQMWWDLYIVSFPRYLCQYL